MKQNETLTQETLADAELLTLTPLQIINRADTRTMEDVGEIATHFVKYCSISQLTETLNKVLASYLSNESKDSEVIKQATERNINEIKAFLVELDYFGIRAYPEAIDELKRLYELKEPSLN